MVCKIKVVKTPGTWKPQITVGAWEPRGIIGMWKPQCVVVRGNCGDWVK